MIDKENPTLDSVTAKKLKEAMRKEREGHSGFKPMPRVRRPRLGWLNWEKHKRKLERKRRVANIRARKTRRAQRRASRA